MDRKPVKFSEQLVTRLAPTPSGYLHPGNVLSFVLSWLVARKAGGKVILRIDDLDRQRHRQEYVAQIFRLLRQIGLDWEVGPQSPAELERQWSQLYRRPAYEALIQRLLASGAVFACGCSRSQIQEATTDGQYPGTCRDAGLPLDTAKPHAWRIRTPTSATRKLHMLDGSTQSVSLHQQMRDFVIRRKDALPAYQIASLADDLQMGINWILRGEDLISSSAAQQWLAELLGEDAFGNCQIVHHPLLTDPDGNKLSKSQDAAPLDAAAISSETLFAWLGQCLLQRPAHSLADLLDRFSWQHCQTTFQPQMPFWI